MQPSALGAVVRAEAAGEEAVAVGDVDHVAGPPAGGADRARDQVGPGVDVVRRVADDGRLAGRARRGMDAHAPARAAPRTCRTDSCRAGRLLTVNGNFARSASDFRSSGWTPLRVERAAVVRHVVVGVLQRSSAAARAAAPAARRGWRARSARARRARGRFTGMSCLLSPFGARHDGGGRLSRVRAAADERDALAALVGDLDVVDAGAAGLRDLDAACGEHVAAPRRREEVDAQPGGDGELVVRVAGEGEGRVGQRRDEAAVADVVAVEHVVAHRHRRVAPGRRRWRRFACPGLRGAVAGEHVRADLVAASARRARSGGGCASSALPSPQRSEKTAARLAMKAATPSRKSCARAERALHVGLEARAPRRGRAPARRRAPRGSRPGRASASPPAAAASASTSAGEGRRRRRTSRSGRALGRVFGAELVAEHRQAQRAARPTRRGSSHGPPQSGTRPIFGERLDEAGRASGEHDVAEQREVRAGAGGDAVDRRDDRHRHRAACAAPAACSSARSPSRRRWRCRRLAVGRDGRIGQVLAGAKAAAGAGDDDAPDVAVAGGGVERRAQLGVHRPGEAVERLGAIEGQRPDAGLVAHPDERFFHGVVSFGGRSAFAAFPVTGRTISR